MGIMELTSHVPVFEEEIGWIITFFLGAKPQLNGNYQ